MDWEIAQAHLADTDISRVHPMLQIDAKFILKVAPKFSGERALAQKRIVEEISPFFSETLELYDINTFLRIAHFMGQVTHECAGFRTTEEFASGDAYEGRKDLGNVSAGDGKRYKGRGLLQLTGRANYRRMSAKLGLPLEDEPEIAGDPVVSLKIACEYWKDRTINDPADQDDLVSVTKKVNGGDNGIAARSRYLKVAKETLASLAAAERDRIRPTLYRGLTGTEVGELQLLLRKRGYLLAVDNEFGAATELAVKTMQAGAGIPPDGLVGPRTWALFAQ